MDVGCGCGGTANWFRRHGWGEVTGVDIDAVSLEYARQRYPGVRFLQQDACRMEPEQFHGFDLVYLFTALYAFPDHLEALRRMRMAARRIGTGGNAGLKSDRDLGRWPICNAAITLRIRMTVRQAAFG
ncbi:class I SAM-dependent methyltransferase [Methylococcus capsulatus]|uniref:Class I SAM-dependent methyltransferase n=1 Tax=Methylococcus capsulatus TaxID=414 RepID=A0ABZ2FAV1_METCP|nr:MULTISPECIES: class I SAM-dependent methyltransferase [Methylococcus]